MWKTVETPEHDCNWEDDEDTDIHNEIVREKDGKGSVRIQKALVGREENVKQTFQEHNGEDDAMEESKFKESENVLSGGTTDAAEVPLTMYGAALKVSFNNYLKQNPLRNRLTLRTM